MMTVGKLPKQETPASLDQKRSRATFYVNFNVKEKSISIMEIL